MHTALHFFALLVVLETSGKFLIDGEIDIVVGSSSIVVEKLGAFGWRFLLRHRGLGLHLARHLVVRV